MTGRGAWHYRIRLGRACKIKLTDIYRQARVYEVRMDDKQVRMTAAWFCLDLMVEFRVKKFRKPTA